MTANIVTTYFAADPRTFDFLNRKMAVTPVFENPDQFLLFCVFFVFNLTACTEWTDGRTDRQTPKGETGKTRTAAH